MPDQIDTLLEIFMGDVTYDGDPVSRAMLSQLKDVQIIVPPHKTAVISAHDKTRRNQQIRVISQCIRIAWQMNKNLG